MKYLITLIVSVLFLVGCGGDKSQASADKPTAATHADTAALRVALMPTVDCLPFYYARRSGLYDSLGLDVDFRIFTAQMDVDTAMSGGSIDGGFTDLVRAELMYAREGTPVVVMATDGSLHVVVARSLRIRRPEQLKDRMVTVARHSATDLMSDLVAQAGGLAEDLIYRPQINDIGLRTRMLDGTQIDAAVLPEPQATAAVLNGHRRIYDNSQAKFQPGCVVFRRSCLQSKSRKAQLRKLIEGYNRAAESINRGGKAVCDSVLLMDYRLTREVVDTLRLPRYRTATLPAADDLNRALDFLRRRGLVEPSFSVEKLTDGSYLK